MCVCVCVQQEEFDVWQTLVPEFQRMLEKMAED